LADHGVGVAMHVLDTSDSLLLNRRSAVAGQCSSWILLDDVASIGPQAARL
jgi:hypothetical protein